jgi:hypothetical protein
MNPFARIAIVALGCAIAAANTAQAQNSANASVTATVQQPLTVSKSNDLAFGSVFPGLNKTVGVTDAGAAAFSVSGQAGGSVNLTFSAPTTIASGGNTMPVASWTGRWNTTNSAAAGTDFTPSASATSATLSGSGAIYVFVGATAQPAAAQTAGTYSGTLTLTVVYF